jgi:hypothetical protein
MPPPRRTRSGLFAALLCLALTAPVALAQKPGPPILPDPKLTPGASLPVTVDDIKVKGYAHKVRDVPQSVKDRAYAEYGITGHKAGEYEVDHLISLELGGSNSLKNLWPESYKTRPWNAHVKDQLENKLHDLVVSGRMTLPDAQRLISTDWIAAYKSVFRTDVPMTAAQARSRGARTKETSAASPSLLTTLSPTVPAGKGGASAPMGAAGPQVWVNTKSGKYFQPGARFYGKTKEGKYMTENDAKKAGYVAAGG